jgi:uncharacterized Zn finger protein
MSTSLPKCPACEQEAGFEPYEYPCAGREIVLYRCNNCGHIVGVVDNSSVMKEVLILRKRVEEWSETMQQILTEYQVFKRNQMGR